MPRGEQDARRRFLALPSDVRSLISTLAKRLGELPDGECANAIEALDRVSGKILRERGPAVCPQ